MRDEDRIIDLHPSEWHHEEHYQPFFGPAAKLFLIMFLLGFPVNALITILVTWELPRWLQYLLPQG